MNVRRRNQLVRAFHTVLYCIPLVILGWIIWQAEGRRRPVRTGVTLGVFAVLIAILYLWPAIGMRRMVREAEDALRESGIDPDAVPERPIPIVPRLKLAKDLDQLLAGILFLVLLVFTFVAYYAGWIERMMGNPPAR